jgi:magnesium chelatase family protein
VGFEQVSTIGKIATQSCPCGNYGSSSQECTCTPIQIQKYVGKISGPLLDRIDIHVEVPTVKYTELSSKRISESSCVIRKRVVDAYAVQAQIKTAMNRLGLSARAYYRILKVSRTIADPSSSRDIRTEHLSEAIQYRSLDRSFYNT